MITSENWCKTDVIKCDQKTRVKYSNRPFVTAIVSACLSGHFGFNCVSPCHCDGPVNECNAMYGNCSTSCMFGWAGFNCSIGTIIIPLYFIKSLTVLKLYSYTQNTNFHVTVF